MKPHKGTGLNNIKETWDRNEKEKSRAEGSEPIPDDATTVSQQLQETIKEEASEYDNANKEDRLLGGDRASVNDDADPRSA